MCNILYWEWLYGGDAGDGDDGGKERQAPNDEENRRRSPPPPPPPHIVLDIIMVVLSSWMALNFTEYPFSLLLYRCQPYVPDIFLAPHRASTYRIALYYYIICGAQEHITII